MKRVYLGISSYPSEKYETILERLTEGEKNYLLEMVELMESDPHYQIFKFNGEKCHWREGDQELYLTIVTEEDQKKFRSLDELINQVWEEGGTVYEDITEKVIYDTFDTSIFGFIKEEMEHLLFKYRETYMTEDDVLDKILKYGENSLSKNDKRLLAGLPMVSPIEDLLGDVIGE